MASVQAASDVRAKTRAKARAKLEEREDPFEKLTGIQLLQKLKVNLGADTNDEVPNLIEDLVLDEEVNLLGGHGGVGKSMLALQAAVAVAALLKKVLGVKHINPHKVGKVLYYSAEDGAKRLRRRIRTICDIYNTTIAEVEHRLVIVDATELDALYSETYDVVAGDETRPVWAKVLGPTASYSALRKMVEHLDPVLLVIDNASDTFEGEEIKRKDVRSFVRSLLNIHPTKRIAVLLLVHFNRADARGDKSNDTGYSGNSAWHNSCRGRSYLIEDNESLRLVFMKNQDGPIAEPLVLERVSGTLRVLGGLDLTRVDRRVAQIEAVLSLIEGYAARGHHIGASLAPNSTTGAWATLNGDPSFPKGLDKRALAEMLRDLKRLGVLIEAQGPRDHNHNAKPVWQVKRSAALTTPAPVAADVPDAQGA